MTSACADMINKSVQSSLPSPTTRGRRGHGSRESVGAPTESEKKGCRRVMARVASLRRARISGNKSQTVCLYQSTRLGAFVLLGPRSPVSVRSNESWAVGLAGTELAIVAIFSRVIGLEKAVKSRQKETSLIAALRTARPASWALAVSFTRHPHLRLVLQLQMCNRSVGEDFKNSFYFFSCPGARCLVDTVEKEEDRRRLS